jgi:hypothetical protein
MVGIKKRRFFILRGQMGHGENEQTWNLSPHFRRMTPSGFLATPGLLALTSAVEI